MKECFMECLEVCVRWWGVGLDSEGQRGGVVGVGGGAAERVGVCLGLEGGCSGGDPHQFIAWPRARRWPWSLRCRERCRTHP